MNQVIYKNIRDIEGLVANTYILAIAIAIVFVGISMLVAQMIAFQGGTNPRDPVIRRIWFFILAVVAAIAFFAWNYFVVLDKIRPVPVLQNKFLIHAGIATGVCLLGYLLIGFILSKLMKKGKYGTIFP